MITSRIHSRHAPRMPSSLAEARTSRRGGAILCSVALIALPGCGGGSDAPADPTQVSIESGPIQGVKSQEVLAFKGIPFAAPPVGELRWRPPQPVTPWRDVRMATSFGNDCAQITGSATQSNPVSEDCLYLNVWRPAEPKQALPVMVWIYGGGYVTGGSSYPSYDGTQFAKQGVVLVTLNYRLGRIGFFGHPALTAAAAGNGEPLGNYGYMDQIAALQWVQRNAAAFGGDPTNVTIFGESAGGESIHNLVTSPAAAGLFHKVINESGNGRVNQAFGRYLQPTPNSALPSAEEQGVAYAQRFGITGTDASALKALRGLNSKQLVDNADTATFAGGSIIDGRLVPEEPQVLYNKGSFNKLPTLIGINDADLGFPKPAATKDEAFSIFGPGNLLAARAAFDPLGSATLSDVRGQIARVITMDEPARFVARSLTAQGVPAYLYRFSYVPDALKGTLPGATHGLEIPFVFNTLESRVGGNVTDRDRSVARTVQSYWVAFAKTGKPAVASLPDWPAFNPALNNLLEFTSTATVQLQQPDPLKAQIDLVQPLNEKNLTVNAQYGL